MIKLDSVEPVGKADKLKPCPFCGGEAQIARAMHMGMRTYRFFVVCIVCGAEMSRTSRTMTQAAKAWNRRADNG